jgi:uncharacterized BrkB/YihY/UPF0761 family membrane protein
MLVEEFELGVLRDEYGIVGDVIVIFILWLYLNCHLFLIFLAIY